MEAVLWLLLMFTPPGEQGGGTIRVLDHYTKKSACEKEEARAIRIGLPPGALVTCVSMKRPDLA